jgi:hypothetical protein
LPIPFPKTKTNATVVLVVLDRFDDMKSSGIGVRFGIGNTSAILHA